MSLDDLPLRDGGPERAPVPQAVPPPRSPKRWIILGAGAVIVVALLTLWWMSRSQPRTATPAPTQATDVAVGSNRPKRQPLNLPSLDASDALLRDLVGALSRHPLIARFLATDGIVRSGVLAVEQVGDGRTPAVPLKIFRPDSRLAIAGGATGRIDPRTYARWDAATRSLTSINPQEGAQLYVNVQPLFDDAYRELGHPNGDFDDSIVRAIGMLQDTPAITGEPELIRRPGYYEHVDPALRSLRPVQKQFLLIGPDNRGKILDWLARFAKALDLKI
jgi:hypothetical protein